MKKARGILPGPRWLKVHGYGGLLHAMYEHPEAFAHIQQSKQGQSIASHIRDAERLMRKHGILPHRAWLIAHGCHALVGAIQRHPDAFRHIPRDNHGGKSIAKHVLDAEQLAKRYGALPRTSWLKAHRRKGLLSAIYSNPSAFAHIRREYGRKSVAEYVQDAERLSKRHGRLPNCQWLIAHGYAGIDRIRRGHPEAFAHIQQDNKKGKSLAEHVRDAEQLAKKHGKLPHYTWLRTHGHCRLADVIARKREKFAHIKQEYQGGKGISEHVRDAEKLAGKHGELPSNRWLSLHGYNSLVQAKQRKPSAFAHLVQTPERDKIWAKHVQCARRLAKKHGKLPNLGWLQRHGYASLYRAIKKRPELFTDIPRGPRCRHTPLEWVPEAEKLAQKYGGLPDTSWLLKNGYSGLVRAMQMNKSLFAHLKP